MTNIITLKSGIEELNRSRHFAKLVIEMSDVMEMLGTLQTKKMLALKSYCLTNDIIDEDIYDNALMARHDVIQKKMTALENSKGE